MAKPLQPGTPGGPQDDPVSRPLTPDVIDPEANPWESLDGRASGPATVDNLSARRNEQTEEDSPDSVLLRLRRWAGAAGAITCGILVGLTAILMVTGHLSLTDSGRQAGDNDDDPEHRGLPDDPGPSIGVERLSFSSDGRRLLVEFRVYDGHLSETDQLRHLTLLDARTGAELWTLRDRPDTAGKVFWIPNTRQIVMADAHDVLCVWDTEQGAPVRHGEPLRRFEELSKGESVLAISADGRRALTVGDFGNAIWDIQTGKLLRRLDSAHGVANYGSLSRDGRLALTVFMPALEYKDCALWDLDTGIPLRVWEKCERRTAGSFTPDGKGVLLADTKAPIDEPAVILWEIATAKERWRSRVGHGGTYTPDGKAMLTLHSNGLARVDLATGVNTELWEAPFYRPPDQWRADIAISPDCSQLVAARGACGGQYSGTSIRLELWDAQTGRMTKVLAGFDDP